MSPKYYQHDPQAVFGVTHAYMCHLGAAIVCGIQVVIGRYWYLP